jgi:hypothetical protein
VEEPLAFFEALLEEDLLNDLNFLFAVTFREDSALAAAALPASADVFRPVVSWDSSSCDREG